MKHRTSFIICALLMFNYILSAQSLSPSEIIEKSIKYHDPEGHLLNNNMIFDFLETRPNGADSRSTIHINVKEERFSMAQDRDGVKINSAYNRGEIEILVDGKKEYSKDITKKYRLSDSRVSMMKNYYEYLWLMPLKLNDAGTIVDPKVKDVDFFGKPSLELKVTYDPTVGKDVWYFYFHPESYALQGYRFYHDEEKNDGEYILLEGEAVNGSIRLPKSRTWYTHKEDKLLGTDILEKFRKLRD